MEYTILQTESYMSLESTVNEHIEKSWKPLGGVSTMCVDGVEVYTQSMTRCYQINKQAMQGGE